MLAELNIIGLIIAIVVAIIASFVKKKTTDEEWEVPPELKPRRPQPPQPARTPARSWEEELRQILAEGRQPPPPPIVRIDPPVPPPMPVTQEEYEPHLRVDLPTLRPQIEHTFQPLAGLTEATERYAAATALEQRVQQHMQTVTTHRVAATTVHHARSGAHAAPLIESLRRPDGARSAILASIILGPPRALSENY